MNNRKDIPLAMLILLGLNSPSLMPFQAPDRGGYPRGMRGGVRKKGKRKKFKR